MPSSGKTSLGFHQWSDDDIPIFEDHNEDNRLLNEEITANRSAIATANSRITEVDGRVATMDNRVTGISDSLTSVNNTLNQKASLASPAFTGTPTAPTPATGTNNTQIASTAFVHATVNNGLSSRPTVQRGSWNPVLVGSIANPSTPTVISLVGRYVKIGPLVTLFCNADGLIYSNSGSGDMRMSGLPFPINEAGLESGTAVDYVAGITLPTPSTAVIYASASNALQAIQFYYFNIPTLAGPIMTQRVQLEHKTGYPLYLRFTLQYISN